MLRRKPGYCKTKKAGQMPPPVGTATSSTPQASGTNPGGDIVSQATEAATGLAKKVVGEKAGEYLDKAKETGVALATTAASGLADNAVDRGKDYLNTELHGLLNKFRLPFLIPFLKKPLLNYVAGPILRKFDQSNPEGAKKFDTLEKIESFVMDMDPAEMIQYVGEDKMQELKDKLFASVDFEAIANAASEGKYMETADLIYKAGKDGVLSSFYDSFKNMGMLGKAGTIGAGLVGFGVLNKVLGRLFLYPVVLGAVAFGGYGLFKTVAGGEAGDDSGASSASSEEKNKVYEAAKQAELEANKAKQEAEAAKAEADKKAKAAKERQKQADAARNAAKPKSNAA